MAVLLIAIFTLVLAIIVGGMVSFFNETLGMAIGFGLFCIGLIAGVIGALTAET